MSHRIRTTILLAFFIAAPAMHAMAQDYTAFDFLRIPMNARAAALGNTYLTARNDVTTLFTNPGALSTLEGPSASVGFLKHLLDVNAGYAVYGQKWDDLGWFSAGIVFLDYGSFEETDKFGDRTGKEFGASDLALSLGYGNAAGNLHYGAALKIIHSSIEEFSSTGLAVDAGISYYIPDQQMVLAAGVQNAGMQVSAFGDEDESLPLDVRVGVGKKLEHLPLNIMLNFHKLNESSESFFDRFSNFSLGGEFDLSDALKARIGYYNEMRRELKIGSSAKLAGFSGGFGLKVATYFVDYAYTSLGEIGAMHRFSLSTNF
ncbi:MAG: type IX secretion system protein PorQ [Bacteroidetes bacterium]|nr:type IX secretion system protein PorQ [Bacteroidota bacterium]